MRLRALLPAGLIVLAFLALDLAGGRAATSVLSGAAVARETALLGAGYVLAHLLAVILAPILALGALTRALERLLARRWGRGGHI